MAAIHMVGLFSSLMMGDLTMNDDENKNKRKKPSEYEEIPSLVPHEFEEKAQSKNRTQH